MRVSVLGKDNQNHFSLSCHRHYVCSCCNVEAFILSSRLQLLMVLVLDITKVNKMRERERKQKSLKQSAFFPLLFLFSFPFICFFCSQFLAPFFVEQTYVKHTSVLFLLDGHLQLTLTHRTKSDVSKASMSRSLC